MRQSRSATLTLALTLGRLGCRLSWQRRRRRSRPVLAHEQGDALRRERARLWIGASECLPGMSISDAPRGDSGLSDDLGAGMLVDAAEVVFLELAPTPEAG